MSNLTSIDVASKLNESVMAVVNSTAIVGFQKAFMVASAVEELKSLLTPEYMKPIMQLQGNRLGFKTDKDTQAGYSESVVKNCLIEAVLMGVQPSGNQFNIIANNCYITKEGFGYLLSNYKGLSYEIIPQLPRINNDKTSAAILMKVSYSINGGSRISKDIDIPVKMNSMMGTDAVIGKATRKARAWLYNTITGSEIADGDISDYDGKSLIIVPINSDEEALKKEIQSCKNFIDEAGDEKTLKDAEKSVDDLGLRDYYEDKLQKLKSK